jgi:hypothetical protein
MNTTGLITAALTLVLAACGSADDDSRAQDRSDDAPAAASSASPDVDVVEPPVPDGLVRTATTATVIDTGDGPELCLGPIAESYPPQCSGPPVADWAWPAQAPNFDRQGSTRWGAFAVAGRWDGATFTVTDAVPAALYDPVPLEPASPPAPSRDYGAAELEAVADELAESLPGAQGAYADTAAGQVLVDVTYDDGSLQDHVDEAYGAGVVVVSSALVDA